MTLRKFLISSACMAALALLPTCTVVDINVTYDITGLRFLGCVDCGLYNCDNDTDIFIFDKYTQQIGVGSDSFQIVNPNTMEYVRITGLDNPLKPQTELTINIQENITGNAGGEHKVKVEKVSGNNVWLLTEDGLGIVIQK